jgi:hypothetical protein
MYSFPKVEVFQQEADLAFYGIHASIVYKLFALLCTNYVNYCVCHNNEKRCNAGNRIVQNFVSLRLRNKDKPTTFEDLSDFLKNEMNFNESLLQQIRDGCTEQTSSEETVSEGASTSGTIPEEMDEDEEASIFEPSTSEEMVVDESPEGEETVSPVPVPMETGGYVSDPDAEKYESDEEDEKYESDPEDEGNNPSDQEQPLFTPSPPPSKQVGEQEKDAEETDANTVLRITRSSAKKINLKDVC